MGDSELRVLIADDQPRTRQSLRALLATWAPVGEIFEAVNAEQALCSVETCRPDVVLMDVRMPKVDGLEATRRLKARWPDVRVVVLSMYGEYQEDALAAGADRFVTKGEPAQRVLEALT